jgi:phosphatidylserine/phosphatidylglycerophosphate/cardiolipin synthase-like enzyme
MYEIFKKIFLADFTWTSAVPYHPNILLSPDSSRTKIETLIQSANTSLIIYMQYLLDEDIETLILEKANEWVLISTVMPKTYFKQDSNRQQILRLESAGIILHELTPDSIHAKAILVDDIFLYIWSINMSSYSLDYNREMWIIINDTHIIQSFLQQYRQDIKIALQKQR